MSEEKSFDDDELRSIVTDAEYRRLKEGEWKGTGIHFDDLQTDDRQSGGLISEQEHKRARCLAVREPSPEHYRFVLGEFADPALPTPVELFGSARIVERPNPSCRVTASAPDFDRDDSLEAQHHVNRQRIFDEPPDREPPHDARCLTDLRYVGANRGFTITNKKSLDRFEESIEIRIDKRTHAIRIPRDEETDEYVTIYVEPKK